MMTSAMTVRSHRRATTTAATAPDAKLATMRILRANQPPRDTRQAKNAVIKNDGSGCCEPALRDSQFPMKPIVASST
jgi:hypothetical protein